jgi:ubiquinone/menaquinone biosynthesis C-methylase UbiE
MSQQDKDLMRCLKCGQVHEFKSPDYDGYHEKNYIQKKYRRNPKTDPQMAFILRRLSINASDNALDIGCGVGDYTREIFLMTKNITGIDRDVTNAARLYPQIKFLAHDCNASLPFPDESIDIITAINVIEHLVDFNAFLSECRRVMKKDGRIALTTANRNFALHDYFFDPTHLHEWSIEEFRGIVEQYFVTDVIMKSSAMFNYYPLNLVATMILKPDLLFIGFKNA